MDREIKEDRERIEREKEEKEERERIESDRKIFEAVIDSIDSILSRQRKIDDPVIRHCLFVDKLATIIDISKGMVKALNDKILTDDTIIKTDNIFKSLQEDLSALTDHIRKNMPQ